MKKQSVKNQSRYALAFILAGFLGLCATINTANTAEASEMVNFETSVGSFVVEVDSDAAPVTSSNFLAYVDANFYDGLVFHRVIPGFVVQGGGYTPDGRERSTNAPIKYEGGNGLDNDRGTIAMARTSDPHSASSQFYVNLVDNDSLNHSAIKPGYTVFGRVVEGMETIDKIAELEASQAGRAVEILRAERVD